MNTEKHLKFLWEVIEKQAETETKLILLQNLENQTQHCKPLYKKIQH